MQKSPVRVFCEETWRFAFRVPKRPARPRQNGTAREAADGGGAGRGAGGAGFLWDIPPRCAPGGCEAARESRWTLHVNDALQDGFLRIFLATMSERRRAGLGVAGLFAARYETRDGHDPRMRRTCQTHDVPRWSMCGLLWSLHVLHEFVFLRESVPGVREHCARLGHRVSGCERF